MDYLQVPQGRVPDKQLLQAGREIQTGLNYLHEHKLAHNDVKASNIFFNETGCCLIGDLASCTAIGNLQHEASLHMQLDEDFGFEQD